MFIFVSAVIERRVKEIGEVVSSPFGKKCVKIQVLTAVSMKLAVFWVVACCRSVEFTDVSEVFAASMLRATFQTAAQKTAILEKRNVCFI
jgi:hypothetical protein